ncbi:MAG: PAS domain-containing protein [Betaproteobacteria bacterium]|nr:PAS domain-containing protein [Betaproteobacteria bacterium]
MDFRYQFANQAVCDLMQRPLADMLGQDDFDFFDAETASKLRENDRRVIEGGESLSQIEETILLSGGEELIILSVKVPMRDGAGKIVGLLGVSTDLTEQQNTRNALREVSSELEATLHAIPDLLFEIDESGLYLNIWANDADELLFSREALLGKRFDEVMPPEAAATCRSALNEAAATGRSRGQRIYLPLPAGPQWFELSVTVKPGDWQPPRFMVLSRNVSAAVADQLSAAEARAEMQSLLAQADASRLALLSILEDQKIAEASLRKLSRRLSKARKPW